MRIVRLPLVLGCLVGVSGPAFAASPTETVALMARRATAPSLKDKSVENAFFSQSLKAAEKMIDDAHWQDFNGDPITGSQSPQDCLVLGVVPHGNEVLVRYSADRGKHSFVVRYVMINEGGAWKVNDIIYAPVGRAERGSFRRMMTAPIRE